MPEKSQPKPKQKKLSTIPEAKETESQKEPSGPLLHLVVSATKAETFQQIFQNVKLFTEHVTLYFEEGRFFLQTMDHSHVSVVECVLPVAWFDTYELQKPIKIGVNVLLLSKILSTRDKQCNIVIGMQDADTLTLHFPGDTLVTREFDMPLLELDTDLLNIPEQEYDADLAMPSVHFAELVQQLRLFGDTLDMQCSEERIAMNSVSLDKGRMRSHIDIAKLTSYSIVEEAVIRMSFALTYLGHICAFHKLASIVEIKVKAEQPLQVTYLLQGVLGAHMRFYLAPKLSDDDDDD